MADYFFDSRALAKRYVVETGSAWVGSLAGDPANSICVAATTRVELEAAPARRLRGGTLSASAAATAAEALGIDFSFQYLVSDISQAMINSAAVLARHFAPRGYDAVQLAAALDVNRAHRAFGLPPLTFVSADDELNAAAGTEGLAVGNHNHHP